MGMTAERNASPADITAIGIANRMAHFTPQRFMKVKNSTILVARSGTGNHGKYH